MNNFLTCCLNPFSFLKGTSLLVFVIAAAIGSDAQQKETTQHKKLRTDFMVGSAFDVKGSGKYTQEYGVLLGVEPRYNLSGHFALGLRYVYSQIFNSPDDMVQSRKSIHTILIDGTGNSEVSIDFKKTFLLIFTTG